jgi:DNA-binding NarL/FixJ family response regulator
MNKSRILVLDPIPVIRAGIVHWLTRVPDLTCCGEADSLAAARDAAVAARPDLVVLDLDFPDGEALELVREWAEAQPMIRTLVFSAREEEVYAHRALRAGARGYLMKRESRERVVEAIRAVLRGQVHVGRAVKAHLVDHLFPDPSQPASALDCLSDRELEVFRLLGLGHRAGEIARRLRLSPKTVETHREHLKEKLGYSNGAALVTAATLWAEKGTAPAPGRR